YASRQPDVNPSVMAQAHDEQLRLEQDLLNQKGHERLADLRQEMQKTMEDSAGIYRSGPSLAQGLGQLRRIKERFTDVAIEDQSRTFNTERTTVLELSFMLDVAEAIITSALGREESRGAHQRTDFPARDDVRFLAHSLTYRQPDDTCRVEYLPVTITRWPPAERVYGEAASHARPHHVAGGALPTGEGV
ncbi:MAG: succinate dehydrogenase/fumarate reductase flavoprotein subunit, partial [bacterium]